MSYRLRAGLDAAENRKISRPCQEPNLNSSALQPVDRRYTDELSRLHTL
jgi:hypothetical protein